MLHGSGIGVLKPAVEWFRIVNLSNFHVSRLVKYSKIQIGCREAERARHVCDTMDRDYSNTTYAKK